MSESHEQQRRRMRDPHAGTGFVHPEEMRASGPGAVPPGAVSLLASMITRASLATSRGWRRWRERR